MRNTIIILYTLMMSSCFDDSLAQRDVENSKKLKIGMSFSKAIEIMGQPIDMTKVNKNRFSHKTDKDSIYIFYYRRPEWASSGVSFDTDSLTILVIRNKLD